MTLHELKLKLSAIARIEILCEKLVFTLLLTGDNLTNMKVNNEVLGLVTEYTKERYPVIETMKNGKTFFCIVLKAKQ